ncbi:hypothetical protein ACXZ1K_18155 [Pedobacter sp. PWIIR3]
MRRILLIMVPVFCFIFNTEAQITLGSYNSGDPNINTYTETQSGSTTNSQTTLTISNIPYGTNLPAGWTLKIKANGPFTNGSNSIASQYVSLKFRSVDAGPGGVSGSSVPLTATPTNLIATANALTAPNDYYVAQKFDLIIQGGSHLLVSTTGTFSTTLTLSLYNNLGALIATNSAIPVSFNVNFSNSCSGAALSAAGGTSYNFDTYAKVQSGGTAVDALTLQYNPNAANCIGWSLKIRANGNFVNGLSSVAPQYVSLKFNRVTQGNPSAAAIGISNSAVPLSMSDVNLITQSNAAFQAYNYTEQKFDMVIQGGIPLMLATTAGTYTCPVTLSLYNQNNQLVSTANANLSFQITYASSLNYTVTLTNPDVSLQYSTPATYTTGVSVTKTNGLRVVGYTAYQVIIKASDANLINGSNTIPVSVVSLQTTPPTGKPGIITTTRSLSTSDQTIITNSMLDYTYQTTDYTLKYTIAGNNSLINSAPSGSYATQVIYVVLPL